jgi:hypothetical protein
VAHVDTKPDGSSFYMNNKTMQRIDIGNHGKPEKNTYDEAYDKGNADDAIALNKKLSDAAATAVSTRGDYAMLGKALSNPDTGQGIAGPVRNMMNKAYVTMGLGDEKTAQAAADGDIINSLGPKMALQIVSNGGDKLLPGSMSDSDLKLVRRFGNGETLEPAANRQLLQAAIRHNERTMEAEEVRQKAIEANGGRLPQNFRSELGKLRTKWVDEDAARESAAAAATQTPATTNTFKTKSGKTLNWSY